MAVRLVAAGEVILLAQAGLEIPQQQAHHKVLMVVRIFQTT
jgi:hypothetical protein